MRYLILFLLFTINAQARLFEADKAFLQNENILENPSFVNGKEGWGAVGATWSVTGSGRDAHAVWDAAGAAETICSDQITIPNRLKGKNGYFYMEVEVDSGTASHTVYVNDASTMISNEVTVTSSTTPARVSGNFIFPTSSTVQICIESQADEPSIDIYSAYLGDAANLTEVSQVQVAGASYFAGTTNCTGWARTSTTIGAFASDADCPGPTVEFSNIGTWATTDSDLPRQTITNLPAGRYRATFNFATFGSSDSTPAFAITDGTTTCRAQTGPMKLNALGGGTAYCWFNYTTPQASVSFELYAASASGTVTISNGLTSPATNSVSFELVKYPLDSDVAIKADQTNRPWTDKTLTMGGFGTIATDDIKCRRQGENMECMGYFTAGTLPATTLGTITIPDSKSIDTSDITRGNTTAAAGQIVGHYGGTGSNRDGYLVTATGTSSTLIYFGDGSSGTNGTVPTNSDGIFSNSELISFYFSVPIEGWTETMNAPLIKQSVVTSSDGVTGTESAKITYSAGTPSATQFGNWISSVTDNNTGDATLNFVSGTFSSAPHCYITPINPDASARQCAFVSTDTTPSASAVRIIIEDCNTATNEDADYQVMCIGPR